MRLPVFLGVSLLFCSHVALSEWIPATNSGVAAPSALLSEPKHSAETKSQVGCGLPQIVGRTVASVLFVPTESTEGEPLRHVLWSLGSHFGRSISIKIAGRILDTLPGSANGLWFASPQAVGVRAYSLPGEVLRAEGILHPRGTPVAFSWAKDGSGASWLFLETLQEQVYFIEAFRKERSKWRAKGAVAGNLLTPRGVPGERSRVICGQWVFSAANSPRRIPVIGQPGLAETYPGPDSSLIQLSRDDLSVRTSDDGGAHWVLAPLPWPAGAQFTSPPEAIDVSGDAPTIRWVAGGRLVITRFSDGRWSRLLETAIENVHGLSGQAVAIGNRLVLFADCYRIAPGEPDSIRVGIVASGSVDVITVEVR